MAVIFGTMMFLSIRINENMAVQFAQTYIRSLDQFQSMYSSEIVDRVKTHGITIAHDYRERDAAIPFPATFSIDLAMLISSPETGIRTRLYSDFPFNFRYDGGPRDDYERLALSTFQTTADKTRAFFRFEDVDERRSLRFAQAIIMEQSCVDCHNSHPDSPRTDWKVGDVRGAREVILPLENIQQSVRLSWGVTLAVLLAMALSGLGLIFLVVQALRASVQVLSKTNSAYSRFVPHEFMRFLNKRSIIDVQLGDNVERQMCVLFSDIRSFTHLSETMTPEESFAFVNEYLSIMGPIVRSHNGFIDKYIGDSIMALFDSADDAIRASIDMQEQLRDYNRRRREGGKPAIDVGIGLHQGQLRLGTIGEQDRMDGTVISDAVNLASRIEGLTKLYGVPCLISEQILNSLPERDRYLVRLIDRVRVKGRRSVVTLYELYSGNSAATRKLKLAAKGDFERGVELYQTGQFEQAKQRFENCLRLFADDPAAQSYIKRCEHFIADGVADDWDGTLVLDIK